MADGAPYLKGMPYGRIRQRIHYLLTILTDEECREALDILINNLTPPEPVEDAILAIADKREDEING